MVTVVVAFVDKKYSLKCNTTSGHRGRLGASLRSRCVTAAVLHVHLNFILRAQSCSTRCRVSWQHFFSHAVFTGSSAGFFFRESVER